MVNNPRSLEGTAKLSSDTGTCVAVEHDLLYYRSGFKISEQCQATYQPVIKALPDSKICNNVQFVVLAFALLSVQYVDQV